MAVKEKKQKKKLIWSDAERAAWALPAEMTVSQWADKYRILDESSAEPGQWRTDRVPYLREIMDTFNDPRIETIVLKKSTQIGGTQALNNILGYIVDQDPGSTLYVLPTREDSEDVALHTVRPFVFSNNVMIRHLTGDSNDITKKKFVFDRMILYLTGSSSPSALSRRAIRYLLCDEINKYPPFSGREADPISLASERQRTFWNRKKMLASTPTTEHGYITKAYEKSDQREYYVPCPHCGHFQTLKWPNIKLPKDIRDTVEIRLKRLAYYQCVSCKARIDDKHKQKMLESGVWLRKGQKIDKKGNITGNPPFNDTAGFWINSLYSPWLTFSEIAAKWLDCQGDIAALMNFINSWLAEEFHEKTEEVTPALLGKNIGAYKRAVVPDQALVLTAGVDKQKDHFYFVIRAWGYGEESWLIREGRIEEGPPQDPFEKIRQVLFRTKYYFTDSKIFLTVRLACCDSGYDTDKVYDFCRRQPESRATKGQEHQKAPWYGSKIDSHRLTGGRLARGLTLWHIDTSYFKEKLHRHVNVSQGELGCWHLHEETTEDYKIQFCNEVKRVHVDKRSRRRSERWVLRTSGAANHYLDCEVNAAVAADMLDIRYLSREEADKIITARFGPPPAEKQEEKRSSGWIQRRDGWLNR